MRLTTFNPNILWYDRLQKALEDCERNAMSSGDVRRANRARMLRLWANDRAELLAEGPTRNNVIAACIDKVLPVWNCTKSMQAYYCKIQEHGYAPDHDDTKLASDERAMRQAVKLVVGIMPGYPQELHTTSECRIDITNEKGNLLLTLALGMNTVPKSLLP